MHHFQIAIDMTIKKVYFIALVLIVLSNFISLPTIGKPFIFETTSKEFTYRLVPSKGNGEAQMLESFNSFKENNPEHKKLILYRTFDIEIIKFWKWREYLSNDLYRYPLKR